MKKLHSIRTIILAGSLLLQLSTLCFHSRGAAGDVDLSFDPGFGVNGAVNAVAVQPDGKVIVGGYYNARLNSDGRPDSSFSFSAPGRVWALAWQSNGKLLVGHDYGVFRLTTDGSSETNFIPPSLLDYDLFSVGVNAIAVQADGKILIGGGFRIVNGALRSGVARLNADGSLDDSFNPATIDDFFSGVFSIAVQSDGKVVIGGQFMTVYHDSIARLNADGSLDSSFRPGGGPNEAVRSVALQPDGKVLIGGFFSAIGGTNRNGIARLNADGSLDASFNPGTGTDGRWVYSMALQPDGKVLIGGDLITCNGTNRDRIARLNADGSLDDTFDAGPGPHPYIFTIAVQSDGKVIIAGADIAGNVADYYLVSRLNPDGSRDGTFTPGGGVEGPVTSLFLESNGKVVIGGSFYFVNGTSRGGFARLDADGSLDSAFNPGTGFGRIVLQLDGKLLIGGYPAVNGTYLGGIARFNADWTRDSSFNPGTGTDGYVEFIALQSDGKVVIGGDFTAVNGTNRDRMARLHADGSLDGTFNPNLGPAVTIRSIAVQPDGKVLLGGDFSIVGDPNRYGLARLNTDGSLDSGFNSTFDGHNILTVALQPDGKVLVGGYFQFVHGTRRNGLARLNADGSLDESFNPGTGVHFGAVGLIVLQPDGKVLVNVYSLINGGNGVLRLNADGSLDGSFPGTRAGGGVSAIALQPDGKIFIGGHFFTVNGVLRPYVARLYGDSLAPTLSIARSNALMIISWPVTGLSFQLQENTDLSLPNAWSPVAQPAVTNAGQISVIVPMTVGRKFFRLKSQ